MTVSVKVHLFVYMTTDREELRETFIQPTVTKALMGIQNVLLHDRDHPMLLMQSLLLH